MSGTRLAGAVAAMLAVISLTGFAMPDDAASPDSAALPACPQIFGHGGYPSGSEPWKRDQVRQPNHPRGLQDQKNWGASGVEADVQLTRDGTKAVMWHNDTTNALTGSNAPVNTLWWATGADTLQGRTIEVGPYKGETVYTLRQYLDSIYSKRMVPTIEIKGKAAQSLLNADAAIRNRAWGEVLNPIKERIGRQEIILYTHDSNLKPELVARATAAGLQQILFPQANGPVWPDTVLWEEPPPSWQGNAASWQAALDKAPRRMATSWTRDMHTWLQGKCA